MNSGSACKDRVLMGVNGDDESIEGEPVVDEDQEAADRIRVEGHEESEAQGSEEPQEDAQEDEGRKPRIQCHPNKPSKKEVEEHRCTHWPFRSWCRHCVRGRAVSSPHRRKTADAEEFAKDRVPTISIDHCFMGDEEGAAKDHPVLVIYDNQSGSIYAIALESKAMKPWIIRYVYGLICEMGYAGTRIAIKCDGAPELKALRQGIANLRSAPTVPLDTPVKESKANGGMEKSVRTWQGQYRTIKDQMEFQCGIVLPRNHAILKWCAWWAASLLNRFSVKANGRTPYESTTGHKTKQPIACFGERILWQNKRSVTGIGKNVSEWFDGVFIGMSGSSPYLLVGTEQGIQRTTSFRTLEDGKQWDKKLIECVKVGLEEYVDPGAIPQEGNPPSTMPIPVPGYEIPQAPDATSSRRMMLNPEDFTAHGYTDGCPGCDRIRRGGGGGRRGHSDECRTRIETELSKTNEGRRRK